MFRKLIGFGFAGVLPFVVAASLLKPRPVTVSLPEELNAADAVVAPTPALDPDQQKPAEGPTDLFGNPVTDAVARYKFDATGSLYELHSPQTEVPRLRPPKT